ncbi:acetyl-CoA hydrolase [Roseiarcus fermentans]|uniref:Acetyl-CoA hydrolase n=1 Tax=Roseiarcus fermentans TaxID=1473586 RepID=A0A366F851_9HYPH|nr:acetyl-CoA hydrolase/transferase C-terminal domain-containing protein [Roseiarcus fermentans]RBP09885.1 acetyl-CoA hydrolase [Roseiarcus fermentans]
MPTVVELDCLDFAALVRPGEMICWGQASAEPLALTSRLMAQRQRVGGFRAFIGISLSETPDPAYADSVRFSSFCGTGTNRRLASAGVLDIFPAHYSDLPGVLGEKVDVLMLQLAEHPQGGRFSLSCASDYVEDLAKSARIVIAEVNRQAPYTSAEIAIDDIDVIVRTDRRLLEMGRREPSELDLRIAANVAALIEDGATLQFGLGALSDRVADLLSDRRELGLHTGVLTDGAMRLIEGGAITNSRKPIDTGYSVAGTLLGSGRLLAFAHMNASIRLRPVGVTHAFGTLAALPALTAINSALEVDLFGQINTEAVGKDYVGAIGGAVDFLRGARASKGGLPIIALPSVAHVNGETKSRIVPRLSGAATIARADAAIIVTEHGAVDLRGLSLLERVGSLISIAAPQFRDELMASTRTR